MNITLLCDRCKQWLHPGLIEGCVDCGDNLCAACAAATGHRTVREAASAAEDRPQGWTYLRCQTGPYSIHEEEE